MKLQGPFSLDSAMAHSSIGLIYCLLGNNKIALRSYHAAVASATDESPILYRSFLVGEISQLIRLKRFRLARKLVHRELAGKFDESREHLVIAKFLIAAADCDLAIEKLDWAKQSLQAAREWLDVLLKSHQDVSGDDMPSPTGIYSAYVWWWKTEAARRRMANEGDRQIEALKQAVETVRICYDPGGWRAVWDDLALMTALTQLADAYTRHADVASAATTRAEADAIFARRQFPESARRTAHREVGRHAFLNRVLGRLRFLKS